jgi:hypothetical protein
MFACEYDLKAKQVNMNEYYWRKKQWNEQHESGTNSRTQARSLGPRLGPIALVATPQ